MEKIDRLGWAEGFSFTSFGAKIGVRANKPGFVQSLAHLLPPGWQSSEESTVERLYSFVVGGQDLRRNVRLLNLVYGDAGRLARDRELEPILHAFDADVRLSVGILARRRVFVHAGVVGWKGRAIVIPGRTMTGKTSLVAALLRLGAEYYSDEYAVLDLRGRVHPFAKPLSIRQPRELTAARLAAEAFGARTGSKALPIAVILDTHFHEGSRWRPKRASRSVGVLSLLGNTISARLQPARNMPVLRQAVSNAVILKGVRGDAETTARELLALMDAESANQD
jgi:hypothetical protein